jgi:lipoprotein-anchoring transpeptidase ErfK/SrfK
VGLVSAGLLALGLCLAASPATARDDQPSPDPSVLDQRDGHSAPAGDVRVAQFWPFSQRPSPPARASNQREQDARYYYVQGRDIFGNPGPVYRVLGVEKPKKKKPAVDRHKMRTAELLRKAPPVPPTTGPLLLTVSLAKQQMTLYDQGVAIATTPISTGTPSFPTPTGVFSVIQKQWFHRSNLYSAAPMPFMQRLTWSGVALHAGELPGYPASHGCIRLPEDFAVRLWGTTQVGVRVIIAYDEVKPVAFAHPRLFTPKPKPKPDPTDTPMAKRQPPAPDAGPVAALEPLARQGQLSVASVPVTANVLDRVAASEGMTFLAGLGSTLTLVNADGSPIADSVDATDDLDEHDRLAADDPPPATISIVRPGRANEVLEVTEAPQINEDGVAKITVMRGSRPAEIEVIAVTKVAPAPQLALPFPLVSPAPQLALPQLTPAPQLAPALQLALPQPTPAPQVALPLPEPEPPVAVAHTGTVVAASSRRREQQAQSETPPAPQARPLRPGPISVFVSRKERRLFVRKGFEPLFDVPVTIVNPERALGHHVFTAMSVSDAETRWTVVSLPTERVKPVVRVVEGERSAQKRNRRAYTEFVSGPPAASPREALDRIEIPSDAVTRISELMAQGATLIVSDEGLGRETGRETDFTVVLTK